MPKRNPSERESQSLRPVGPDQHFLSLRDAMNKLFEESFWSPFSSIGVLRDAPMDKAFPRVNVSENAKEVKVVADVPGINSKDINIDIESNILTISGTSEHEEKQEDEQYYRYEREYGSFHRSIPLPAMVNEDKVSATVKNGVLTVILPKVKEEKKRSITIKEEK